MSAHTEVRTDRLRLLSKPITLHCRFRVRRPFHCSQNRRRSFFCAFRTLTLNSFAIPPVRRRGRYSTSTVRHCGHPACNVFPNCCGAWLLSSAEPQHQRDLDSLTSLRLVTNQCEDGGMQIRMTSAMTLILVTGMMPIGSFAAQDAPAAKPSSPPAATAKSTQTPAAKSAQGATAKPGQGSAAKKPGPATPLVLK